MTAASGQQVVHVRLRIDRALGRLARREVEIERAQFLDLHFLLVVGVADAEGERVLVNVCERVDDVVRRAAARGIDAA